MPPNFLKGTFRSRFGDRFRAPSAELVARRRARYLTHLKSMGVTAMHPLAWYFGTDVFHDSPVHRLSLAIDAKSISLHLTNVHAIDSATRAVADRVRSGACRIHRRDFVTRIQFMGVTEFRYSADVEAGAVYYHQSEVRRLGLQWVMTMSLKEACERELRVVISFKDIMVEDITGRIGKYFPKDRTLAEAISPLAHLNNRTAIFRAHAR